MCVTISAIQIAFTDLFYLLHCSIHVCCVLGLLKITYTDVGDVGLDVVVSPVSVG